MSVIVKGEYVTLSDGATVATDASLGETFTLVGTRATRTMSNPTNPTTGQAITYSIDTRVATVTSWGSAFVLAGEWRDPEQDCVRDVTFRYDGTLWLELGRTGANLRTRVTPADVSDMVAWYDATSLTALSDGAPVGTWTARYGGNPVQATTSQKPLFKTAIQNGLPIVRFDGTDDYLSVASPLVGSTDCSVFAVFAKGDASSTTLRALIDISGTGPSGAVFFENLTSTANRLEWEYGDGVGNTPVIATSVGTAFHQWSVIHENGVAPSLYKDQGSAIVGAEVAATAFALDTMYVGSNTDSLRFMYGDIAELVLYSSALADPDRGTVEAYLKAKWGTP